MEMIIKTKKMKIVYEPDLLQKGDANYFLKLYAREICKLCMFDFDEMD